MTEKTIYLSSSFFFYSAVTEKSSGSIQLSSFIVDIKDLEHTIGTLLSLNINTYNMSIVNLNAENVNHINNTSSSFSANMLVKAIKLLSAQFNLRVQKSDKLLSAIKKIKTKEFDSKDSYVQASLKQKKIKTWLNEKSWKSLPKWLKRRVFIICEILIARLKNSSKVNISLNSNSQLLSDVKVNGVAAQSPIGGDEEANVTFSKEFELGFVSKSPFIYGFRLRELFF